MKSLSKGKKILLVLLSVVLALTGVSVITDTPPFVVINGKLYWFFTKNLNLRNSSYNESVNHYSNKNVKALSHLKWIKNLGMDCTHITDLSFLGKMNSLEAMSYNGYNMESGINNEIKDWSSLSNCKKLERFDGINITGMSDLSVFNGMINLKKLYIEQNPAGLTSLSPKPTVADISDIEYLVNLEVFEIIGNGINDISSIKYCTKLRVLTLYGITATDGSALLELPELERVEIDKGVLTANQIKTLEEKGVKVIEYERNVEE